MLAKKIIFYDKCFLIKDPNFCFLEFNLITKLFYSEIKILFFYYIFIWDDEILLAIIKINKFNHKYWPRKSFSVIGIPIKTLLYFFLEYQ